LGELTEERINDMLEGKDSSVGSEVDDGDEDEVQDENSVNEDGENDDQEKAESLVLPMVEPSSKRSHSPNEEDVNEGTSKKSKKVSE
jgi:hypothetical protein